MRGSTVIDFCSIQSSFMSKWMSNELDIYKELLSFVLNLFTSASLDVAESAMSAIPVLLPDLRRSEFANIRQIAQEGVAQFLANLMTSLQINNVNSPEFAARKCVRSALVTRSFEFEDQNEKDEYLADYQGYVNKIRTQIASLTPVYALPMAKTVLQMWVAREAWHRSLQKGVVSNPQSCKSLLCITEGLNVGMSRNKGESKGYTELISCGRQTVDFLLQQSMGFNEELDQFILQAIFNYLWVLRKDSSLLIHYIEGMATLISQASSAYKSPRLPPLTRSGNSEQQALICVKASELLWRVCQLLGNLLVTQMDVILDAIFGMISSAVTPTVCNNLCKAFRGRCARG